MRLLVASFLTVFVAIAPVQSAESDPCNMSRTAKFEFSMPGQMDIVTATSIASPIAPGGDTIAPSAGEGPNCVFATIVVTVHSPNGALIGIAAEMLVAFDYDTGHQMSPLSPEGLATVLEGLTQVTLFPSSEAPPSDSPVVGFPADGMAEYERLKALNAPAMCFVINSYTQNCLINDAGVVQHFFEVTSL